jgi:hypothetical protein
MEIQLKDNFPRYETAPPQLAPPFQPAEHTDAMDNNMEIDTARSPERKQRNSWMGGGIVGIGKYVG